MPKPVLQAMVLADHVYQDRTTGKFIIAGTFGTIGFGSPVLNPDNLEGKPVRVGQAGSPFLYLALTEVHGRVPLNLKYMDLSDSSVLFEARVEVTSSDPVAVTEYAVPMPLLPAPKPGTYALDLLYDGEFLGSWRISVVKV